MNKSAGTFGKQNRRRKQKRKSSSNVFVLFLILKKASNGICFAFKVLLLMTSSSQRYGVCKQKDEDKGISATMIRKTGTC